LATKRFSMHFFYLTTLAILRPQNVNGRPADAYEAVGGIKTDGRNRSTSRNDAQCHFVHHKSHLGPNLGRNGKPAINRLSTASPISIQIHVTIKWRPLKCGKIKISGNNSNKLIFYS
jgi:hypothetical protein